MNGNFVLLLDIYGELLSKTQREALDLKYNSDLSLSEIAEEMGGISRQSVNEAQRNGEKKLLELERVLKNAEKLVLEKKLAVMDTTATTLSMDNNIPLLVFALKEPENIYRAVMGEQVGTMVNNQ